MTNMPYRLAAADLMTIDPVIVRYDALISDAEALMRAYRVNGLPVVDDEGDLVGVISQTDFVHLSDPSVRGGIHRQRGGLRVGEVMSHPPVTVSLGTPLLEAARVMTTERVHRVVVVDDRHRPLGVLAAMDFVNLYAES